MEFTSEELKDFNAVLKKAGIEYKPPACNICKSGDLKLYARITEEYGKQIYCPYSLCDKCGCYTPMGFICLSNEVQESYDIPISTLCESVMIHNDTLIMEAKKHHYKLETLENG